MTQDRLAQGRSYVESFRAQGRSDDGIRNALVAGWTNDDIAQLLTSSAPSTTPRRRQRHTAPEQPAEVPGAPGPDTVGWAAIDAPEPEGPPAEARPATDAGWLVEEDTPEIERAEHQPHVHVPKPLPRIEVLPERPFALSFLVVMVDLAALFGLFGAGVVGVGAFAVLSGKGGPEVEAGSGGLMLALAAGMALVYLGVLVVAHFLWRGYAWARLAMTILLVLNIALRWFVGGMGIGIGGALMSFLFLRILFTDDVESYCCRRGSRHCPDRIGPLARHNGLAVPWRPAVLGAHYRPK